MSPCPPQDGDLQRFIESRAGAPLSEGEVMLRFVQICLALQYVHSRVGGAAPAACCRPPRLPRARRQPLPPPQPRPPHDPISAHAPAPPRASSTAT